MTSSDPSRDLELPRQRGAVRVARHWAADLARLAGLPAPEVATVELLTSELAANAVYHGAGDTFALRAVLEPPPGAVAIFVTDHGPGLPIVRTTGPAVPGGNGVRLVARLSTTWGTTRLATGGKTVWFTVQHPGPDAR